MFRRLCIWWDFSPLLMSVITRLFFQSRRTPAWGTELRLASLCPSPELSSPLPWCPAACTLFSLLPRRRCEAEPDQILDTVNAALLPHTTCSAPESRVFGKDGGKGHEDHHHHPLCTWACVKDAQCMFSCCCQIHLCYRFYWYNRGLVSYVEILRHALDWQMLANRLTQNHWWKHNTNTDRSGSTPDISLAQQTLVEAESSV